MSKHLTQAVALLHALEDTIADGGGTVHVCIGELCPFKGEADFVQHQNDGCPQCRRIRVESDGSVAIYQMATQ